MDKLTVNPGRLSGNIKAIPSKSYAHRIFICAALSDKTTGIFCPRPSVDILTTIDCLSALGADIRNEGSYSVSPIGTGERRQKVSLNCNESGSTFRFLLPVAAALLKNETKAEFSARGKLPERPIADLVRVLSEKSVRFTSEKLPFEISGELSCGDFTLPGNVSSQYISGLLLALPLLSGDSRIIIKGALQSESYIEITREVLKTFGVITESTDYGYYIKGGQTYISPGEAEVQGDWSNAAFFLTAGALGSDISLSGLNMKSSQGDRKILDILRSMGAEIIISENTVSVKGDKLCGASVDLGDIPDLFPVLAVAASVSDGITVFRNTARLRIKESDRIESVKSLLLSLGFGANGFKAYDNYVEITGNPKGLRGGRVNSFNDHRIAMSAAIAATVSKEPVIIEESKSVEKSYPLFFDDYCKLGGDCSVNL